MKKLFQIVAVLTIAYSSVSAQVNPTSRTVIITPVNPPSPEGTNNKPNCWSYLETSDDLCCHAWSVMCSNGVGWHGNMLCDFLCQTVGVLTGPMWKTQSLDDGSIDIKNPKNFTFSFSPTMSQMNLTNESPLDEIMAFKSMVKYTEFKLESPKTVISGSITYIYQPGIYVISNNVMVVKYYYQ
jgi:hypothetical protein